MSCKQLKQKLYRGYKRKNSEKLKRQNICIFKQQ
jgi:hypothetical protein